MGQPAHEKGAGTKVPMSGTTPLFIYPFTMLLLCYA